MKIRIPPANPHAAPTFLDLPPLADADLHRFITDQLDEETGEIVLFPGSAEETRPDFGPAPVTTEAVVRGLTELMWLIAAHPAAPDYLERRWERLLAGARDVLEHRKVRKEPWLASVRRVRRDLIRMVDFDKHRAAAGKRVEQVPVELIDQEPEQQRQSFPAAELAALVENLRQVGGPPRAHVRRLENGRFRLLTGVRPLRAAQQGGVATLCCEVHEAAPPLGRAQIPSRQAGEGVPRREAMVRFDVEFPAWPEPAPEEVTHSPAARRWIAELEHFRHEAAQDALATAEAALLEHEALLNEQQTAAAAQAEVERTARQARAAALEKWIAEEATEFTRERHRRGWLSERDAAWLIARAALGKARFQLLDAELWPTAEWRVARNDEEMELILALEADLAAAGLRPSEAGYLLVPGEASRLLVTGHLPAPLDDVALDLQFVVPELKTVRVKKPRAPRRKPAEPPAPAARPKKATAKPRKSTVVA